MFAVFSDMDKLSTMLRNTNPSAKSCGGRKMSKAKIFKITHTRTKTVCAGIFLPELGIF